MLAGGAALSILGAGPGHARGVEVACPAGRFIGEAGSDGVSCFLGIRYGTAARFRRAEPVSPSPDPVRAVAFGPACPQRSRRQPQSEDCLTLNVWTPSPRRGAGLAVLFYVHGGAFAFGSASDPVVDGARLAAREVVVVSANHRLNALGYLYLAGLDPSFVDSGNLGQHDLVLALAWVRANVAAFGGDPARVTAVGDSGGGGKVTTLLAMPAAAGLIHRAVTMSGQQVTVSGPNNATRRARSYLARLGIASPAALLDQPVERLVDALDAEDPVAGGPVHMGPVLDMRALSRHPFCPDAHPLLLGVPMLSGTTHDETRGFSGPDDPFVTGMDWTNLPARIVGELPVDLPAEWIIAEYRRRMPGASAADLYFAVTTAGRSWRGQIEVAEARARAGAPIWCYRMDFASRADPRRGAFHGIDLSLLFGNLAAPGAGTGIGADARHVSDSLQRAFLAFAKGKGLGWQPYTLARRTTMTFDVVSRAVDDPRRWERELFARAPYRQPGS